MILDHEEQRALLVQAINSCPVQGPVGQVLELAKSMETLLEAVKSASIEGFPATYQEEEVSAVAGGTMVVPPGKPRRTIDPKKARKLKPQDFSRDAENNLDEEEAKLAKK